MKFTINVLLKNGIFLIKMMLHSTLYWGLWNDYKDSNSLLMIHTFQKTGQKIFVSKLTNMVQSFGYHVVFVSSDRKIHFFRKWKTFRYRCKTFVGKTTFFLILSKDLGMRPEKGSLTITICFTKKWLRNQSNSFTQNNSANIMFILEILKQ